MNLFNLNLHQMIISRSRYLQDMNRRSHPHAPSWYMLSSQATADISYGALIPAVISTALAILIVALRWQSRMYSTSSKIRAEDYLVTVALTFSVGIAAAVGGEFNLTDGRMRNNMPQLSNILKFVFAQSIFYHLSTNFVKASFIFQYIRLFSLIRSIIVTCYLLLVCIAGAVAWGIFGVIFLCSPVRKYWYMAASGVCGNAEDHFWTTGVIGIAIDLVIWVLPMPVVGRLRLPRRQKIGLMGCFGLGGFICTVSILRLVLVRRAAYQGDVTKSGTYALMFSTIEVNVAIICASLLVMKPFFAHCMPSVVSEQAMSAREDGRLWRGATGLHLLDGTIEEDKERGGHDRRRDTGIAMGRRAGEVTVPETTWDPRRRRDGVEEV